MKKINDLTIYEVYYYIKSCEIIIDKLVNDIKCEKDFTYSTSSPSLLDKEYVESENEKQFKIYTKIHNELINQAKNQILELQ